MTSFADALKSEIARISRKQVRAETESLKKAASSARSEIAALKRQLKDVQAQLRGMQRAKPQTAPAPASEGAARPLRFSASRLAAQRAKLGVSAAVMGKLLGVTGATIYNWESGQTRPQRAQLEAIAALRGIGRRQLAELLQKLS